MKSADNSFDKHRVALVTILSACSTTTNELKSNPGVARDFLVSENYQSVYRRFTAAARCTDGAWAGVFASYQTDAQLFPELGMGEISHRLTNVGVNNYYWLVEIYKQGDGARVKIFTANTAANEATADNLEKLAREELQVNC